MPTTAIQREPLMKADYLRLRDRYTPTSAKIIFILESPPASGRYFYNPDGAVTEPLFRAMMRDILETSPKSKGEGLTKFASRGYFLIDATYTPINRSKGKARDAIIVEDFPLLVVELKKHATPETGIVLVKANVCELLEPKLKEAGFNVLNRETKIPFPSSGQQNNFRERVRHVLGM